MIYQEIEVPKYRWTIFAFYDTTALDTDAVVGALYDLDCDYKTATRAYENLEMGKKNTGLCYSNYRCQASVLVISKTTNASEFISTWHHELCHLQAYLTGEVAQIMFPKIKHLFCDCCRKEKNYEKES